MDHEFNQDGYRFIQQGDTLLLEKRVETPHNKMRQWVNVLSGSLNHEDVDGHHDGFTVKEMKMFIEFFDVIKGGRK